MVKIHGNTPEKVVASVFFPIPDLILAEVVWVGEEGDGEWRDVLGVVKEIERRREGGEGGLEEGAAASTW